MYCPKDAAIVLMSIIVVLANQLTLHSLKFLVNKHNDTTPPKKEFHDPPTRAPTPPKRKEPRFVSPLKTNNAQQQPQQGFCSAAQLAGIPPESIPQNGPVSSKVKRRNPDSSPSSTTTSATATLPAWQTELLERNKDLTSEHIERILCTLVPRESNKITAESIGGLADVKKVIVNRIIRPLQRPDLHQGLYKASSGVLLFGPPGTGKTTIAKWIASEANAAFFCISPSTLISMYMGETESLIKALFTIAEYLSPSIIFLDEIDGFIGKRSQKEEETTIRMKNQLLQAMDGLNTHNEKTVIVIGATNRPDALDEAALRRLPKRIYIPLPDQDAIFCQLRHIIVCHAKDIQICQCPKDDPHTCALQNYNYEELRSRVLPLIVGYNGSDIKALCVKAAEIVYQRIVNEFGNDIYSIPSSKSFGIPEAQDFIQAAQYCNRSSAGSSVECLNQWAESFGCV